MASRTRSSGGVLGSRALPRTDADDGANDLAEVDPLAGDLRGFHAVRVNDQYRIVFRFKAADAFDVRCTDYH